MEGPKIGSFAGLRERHDFQLHLSQHDERINDKCKYKYTFASESYSSAVWFPISTDTKLAQRSDSTHKMQEHHRKCFETCGWEDKSVFFSSSLTCTWLAVGRGACCREEEEVWGMQEESHSMALQELSPCLDSYRSCMPTFLVSAVVSHWHWSVYLLSPFIMLIGAVRACKMWKCNPKDINSLWTSSTLQISFSKARLTHDWSQETYEIFLWWL